MDLTAEDFAPTLDISQLRINVDPESRRISARISRWDDIHSGFKGSVKSPRKVNVEAAHGGHALLADGSSIKVSNLSMGTLHADGSLSPEAARDIYENTGSQIARGRYSTDEEGIRFDGVLYSDVEQPVIDRLIASAPSGDWRTFSHLRSMEDFETAEADFVGAAIVNLPGFSGTFTNAPATPMRMVASADGESLILMDSATEETVLTAAAVEVVDEDLDIEVSEPEWVTRADYDVLASRLEVLEELFARAVLSF